MADQPDVDLTVQRIQALVDSQPESAELAQLLMQLYGAGLSRIVEVLRESGAGELLEGLAADKLVASLLLLHGLHPVDAETRLRKALSRVEKGLESQRIVLDRIEDGRAFIRVEHNGGGPPPSGLAQAIERAAAEWAPDLAGVDIEGAARPGGLVQIAMSGSTQAEAEAK